MPDVTVVNDDVVLETSAAVSLLNTLLRAGVAIDHRCGGKAQCGTCRIRIIEGAEKLSPIREAERIKLEKFGKQEGFRLACQTYASGDVTIEVLNRRTYKKREP